MKENKMGMLEALKGGNRALKVLDILIEELNSYNQPDMLNGYLNSLADKVNWDLQLLGLDIIHKVGNTDE